MHFFKDLFSLNKSISSICLNQIARIHYLEFNDTIKEKFVLKMIESSIYQDANIIAFNKPTNTSMHSISYEKLDTKRSLEKPLWSIACVKTELLKHFKFSFMEEIFSQNSKYSGVIVYALSPKVKEIYSDYFKNLRCQRVAPAKYIALCLGKFSTLNGSKQLALSSQIIKNTKMSISTKSLHRGRLTHKIICPTISHQVIEEFNLSHDIMSLVELHPTSTKWESLQLFCVNEFCPILYDGVYGGRVQSVLQSKILVSPEKTKINSQELDNNLINILNLSDLTNSQIPLHLHCYQLNLPLINNSGKNSREDTKTLSKHKKITIEADMPPFFKETIDRLRDASSRMQQNKRVF